MLNRPPQPSRGVEGAAGPEVPAVIAAAGNRVVRRFIGFFTANIRNPNTREAYARAITGFSELPAKLFDVSGNERRIATSESASHDVPI